MTLYDDIAQQTSKLTREEQLRLIAYLAEQARQAIPKTQPRRYWHEIRGAAAYPLGDEDAQAWVSRQRAESDATRAQQWDNDAR